MINLNDLVSIENVMVPIVNNSFQYNRKLYKTVNVVDGWYRVRLENNNVEIICDILPELDLTPNKKSIIKGYTYNDNIVFFNFDEARRKFDWAVMKPLYLSNIRTFSSIEGLVWEDKKVYLYKQSFTDTSIYELKTFFDEDVHISDKKHLNHEQKTLYLFHYIEKQNQLQKIKKSQEAEKRKKQQEEKRSVEDNLIQAFSSVGGDIQKYEIKNNRIYVRWVLSDNVFDSVINAETGQVVDAGFCMSGDDKRHSVTSLVLTAAEYDENNLLHIFNRR